MIKTQQQPLIGFILGTRMGRTNTGSALPASKLKVCRRSQNVRCGGTLMCHFEPSHIKRMLSAKGIKHPCRKHFSSLV